MVLAVGHIVRYPSYHAHLRIVLPEQETSVTSDVIKYREEASVTERAERTKGMLPPESMCYMVRAAFGSGISVNASMGAQSESNPLSNFSCNYLDLNCQNLAQKYKMMDPISVPQPLYKVQRTCAK